jgi:glutamate synthase (NADPH) large chain
MAHRGAESSDNVTGDGAGILVQIPHDFFKKEIDNLPSAGTYGTGILFLPENYGDRDECEKIFFSIVERENLHVIAVRDIPVNNNVLGEIALSTEPFMKQVFISGNHEQDDLERKLYVIRKQAENEIFNSGIGQKSYFSLPSLSTRVMIYKGMFTPAQLGDLFPGPEK